MESGEEFGGHATVSRYYSQFCVHHIEEGDAGNWEKENVGLLEETMLSPSSSSSSAQGATGYIEHRISKFDTLPGIAIKYGVEVADIKKLNGLVTDLQMFALNSLRIPLPGRHPPSCLCYDVGPSRQCSTEETPLERLQFDFLDTFEFQKCTSQRKVPPSSCIPSNNALKSLNAKCLLKQFDVAAEDIPLEIGPSSSPISQHGKPKNLVSSILDEVCIKLPRSSHTSHIEIDSDGLSENYVRRRQKSEVDFSRVKIFARDENSSSLHSLNKAKGLALRSSAAGRNVLTSDAGLITVRQDPVVANGFSGVRKSSSTSSLHEQEGSPLWPASKWNLKPDLQSLRATAIGKPIFDGLPKPLTARRNKTALD